MQCDYYDAGACRSCALLETAYPRQLADKERHVRDLLGGVAPEMRWLPAVPSAESGFRTKAKMVVGGTVEAPTLGILDAWGAGVDLQSCGLYPAPLAAAFAPLAAFVTRARIEPYDVPGRRGELKHVIVTVSPHGELMVRFVARSTEALSRIRKHLAWLHEQLPALRVVSLNVLPEHAAVMEGEREILLTVQESLPMRVADRTLNLRPQSFFQTNTAVAEALYLQARVWIEAARPASVWDLYCGVGGFAFQAVGAGREVIGIEVAPQAIESARETVRGMLAEGIEGASNIRFDVGDATAQDALWEREPELAIVNPPRRGIGADLASRLEGSGVPTVIYSSCNATSLAEDLQRMPSLRPVEAVLLDMFPHTSHYEVAVLLRRA